MCLGPHLFTLGKTLRRLQNVCTAIAYDDMAIQVQGEYAYLNFPHRYSKNKNM